MSQPTLTEHESDDEQESDCVVCPACDYTSDTHEGFEFTTQKVVIVSACVGREGSLSAVGTVIRVGGRLSCPWSWSWSRIRIRIRIRRGGADFACGEFASDSSAEF